MHPKRLPEDMEVAPVIREIFPDFTEDELRRADAAMSDFLLLLWNNYQEEKRKKRTTADEDSTV